MESLVKRTQINTAIVVVFIIFSCLVGTSWSVLILINVMKDRFERGRVARSVLYVFRISVHRENIRHALAFSLQQGTTQHHF